MDCLFYCCNFVDMETKWSYCFVDKETKITVGVRM